MILLPSILTISLCVFILCGSVQLLVFGYIWSNKITEHFQIEVFILESKSEHTAIGDSIRLIHDLDSVVYVSKERAKEIFVDQFGSEMIENVVDNPLPASYKVFPAKKIQTLAEMRKLVYKLGKFDGVETVHSSLDTIQIIEEWKGTFYFWSIVLSIGLVIMLWLIISNAVRLTLFSREILVENMHFCGASEAFIQFPFVLEGFFQGCAGSLLALFAWYVLILGVSMFTPAFSEILDVSYQILPLIGFAISTLGAVTSYRVVKSFMRKSETYNA